MKLSNIDLKGLNTYASHRSVQENYLLDCNNIVCDKAGVISTRRGFSFFNDVLVNCKKIFAAINNVFVNADLKLYYDGGGTFTQVSFPTTDSMDANNSNEKIQIEDQNKSLYFNGKRISSETSNPIDKKIKKLSSVTANVINAGLEAPINLSIVELLDPGLIPNGDSFAIRIFYQYTDENNFLITSEVSDRVVGTVTGGSDKTMLLKFQIPNQYIDKAVNIYYAISEFVVAPIIPSDNLFWSEQTLIAKNVFINNGLTSVFEFAYFIPKASLIDAVDLYTNSSQEGILQNNTPAICSIDIETYQGYTFYANLIDRLQKRLFLIDPIINTTALILDGITYQQSTSTDYTSTPVKFFGNTSYYAALDLCRAITATQTKYKAVFENGNELSAFEWGQRLKMPDDGVAQQGIGATDGNNIYAIRHSDSFFFEYSPIANTWIKLINPDINISYPLAQYYNGKIYLVGGQPIVGVNPHTQVYDITTNIWNSSLAQFTFYDFIFNSTSFIYQDKIYLVGGEVNGIGHYDGVHCYDITNNSWSTKTNLPVGLRLLSAGVYGNYAYIVGGIDATNTRSNKLYIYDIINDSWSTGADYPQSAEGVAVVGYNGYVWAAGGINAANTILVNVYKYDIANDAWIIQLPMPQACEYCLATVVKGVLFITAGFGNGIAITYAQRYKIDGFLIQFQERFIGEETDILYTSNYITNENFTGTSSPLYRFAQKNTTRFSKQGQPEGVPFFNNFQTGAASQDILRLSALRSSLMVLKTDGIYQLNGVSPETFSVQQLDPTFILIAPQSLAKLNNEIYCLTNKGIVSINESGAKILSYPIKDLLDYDIAQVSNLKTDINGAAYEDDYRYVITINNKTYTYNYVSEQWTIWFSGKSDIASWTVFNSNLYYLDSTRAYKERKTMTNADYQDENNSGIDASIKFNNLELNPGNMMYVVAMQILQRNQTNLTAAITPDNNFNSGTLFTQLLDKYIVRVMFPNECRTGFYFRPLIEWNTEVIANPGTFSDLQLEGLDFDYDETASNIK